MPQLQLWASETVKTGAGWIYEFSYDRPTTIYRIAVDVRCICWQAGCHPLLPQ